MASRVVLHVGTMKSGTSYLQRALSQGSDELGDAGAFYVGSTFRRQARAVAGVVRARDRLDPGAWRRLARKVLAREGVAIYSHEFLSFARPAGVHQVVESFQGLEVHVVLTVRDQARVIPAQWQTYTRNMGTDDWGTYLRCIQPMAGTGDAPSAALHRFRRAQNVSRIVELWGGSPGVSAVSVVVVPAPGAPPAELWHRFCAGLGLGRDVRTPEPAATPANESLGYASCDVLRRVNTHITRLPKPTYRRARSRVVTALQPLRADEGRPELDRAGAELARSLNAGIRDVITRHDVTLVGSLNELPVDPVPQALPDAVLPPDPQAVRRAAEHAWRECTQLPLPPDIDVDGLIAELGQRLIDHHIASGRPDRPG